MVGSPGQTVDTLYRDLLFIKELKPEMIGIGPFIPHKDTLFAKELPELWSRLCDYCQLSA